MQQPWAWAIVHGGKLVENRTRNLAGSYRGPVAIHAGLVEDLSAMDHPALLRALFPDGELRPLADPEPLKTRGAVLGVVDLIDVHAPTPWCSEWGQQGDVVHLVLANPRPLAEPIPARGRLGLWNPNAELLDRIREQLPA